MSCDVISTLLTSIRNAVLVKRSVVLVPASSQVARLLKVFLDEGYVSYFKESVTSRGHSAFEVGLRYDFGVSVIRELRRISSPGRRIYAKKGEIPSHHNGLGIVVVSTPKGMLADRVARCMGLGGELVCSVF